VLSTAASVGASPSVSDAATPVSGDAAVFVNTPSAPTDVSTAIVASRFITLTWARPVNADETGLNGYSIYYKRQDSNRYLVFEATLFLLRWPVCKLGNRILANLQKVSQVSLIGRLSNAFLFNFVKLGNGINN
jgi:hypothetical protein